MFQRIKNAVDSRIAEEQARQKTTTLPVPKSASAPRRSTSSRTESPAANVRKAKATDNDGGRGPDPSEFEAAFVIEDESEGPSRVATPSIEEKIATVVEHNGAGEVAGESDDKDIKAKNEKATKKADGPYVPPKDLSELPPDVRVKLRKLEKLEARYQELLRSYRIAHARAVSIEPFEKALKENTPISTISDPDALVEYLNQLNVKGDMVMDEFKRVSTEVDGYKKKSEEATAEASRLRNELALLRSSKTEDTPPVPDATTPDEKSSPAVKSPVLSILGMLSPKQKPMATVETKDSSEEFFSYDEEVPRLQAELIDKVAEIETLKTNVSTLEKSLGEAQVTNSELADKLEKTTRLSDQPDESSAKVEALQSEIAEHTQKTLILQKKLLANNAQLSELQSELETQKTAAEERVSTLQSDLVRQQERFSKSLEANAEANNTAESFQRDLRSQIQVLQQEKKENLKQLHDLSEQIKSLAKHHEELTSSVESGAADATKDMEPLAAGAAPAKKKSKKKKKAGATVSLTPTTGDATEPGAKSTQSGSLASLTLSLEMEITKLKVDIADRDAQIAKLQSKRKTEEDLREELENMQENLLNIGQEHVEAKEKIKQLQAEKTTMAERVTLLEGEINTQKVQSKLAEQAEADLKKLSTEYEDLKLKAATLQIDLNAAEQLATSRYKDLTDLKEILQKAQPELKALRTENATLKNSKEELTTKTSELRRLEAREKDLRADIASFKKQSGDRDNEVRLLNEKIAQESGSRLRLEDQLRVSQRDLRKTEAERIQIAASSEKAAQELTRVQDDASKLRSRVRELEGQVQKVTTEAKNLREEVELRGSQYNNAQGLLGSMRDQSAEMAMQLKEAKEQAESLEEELGEVQRLLSERSREGETMRRLLADVDGRADTRVREMRERMESAIEERDRVEDEASTNARRRARENDELKTKIRDYERDLKRATDDRDELAQSQREWKRRRDELEGVAEKASQEVNDIRAAMEQIRDALDGSEKQVRDAEKQHSDLKRLLEEANHRYEKLQKEFKALQAKQAARINDVSSRSSFDSGRAGPGSPTVAANGASVGKVDYVYLKTILLQFLEQDKKRQMDLVRTVLGQLLHMDKKDQEKWISVISAKRV